MDEMNARSDAKRPSFQFYPGDWLRDTALRSCSIPARGLWIDMICYMHEAHPYGYLKVGSKVILAENLSRMVGLNVDEVRSLLGELVDAGVCSVSEDGCYFSKRMVRDEKVRKARAAGGSLGGNPALLKGRKPQKDNLQPNLDLNNEAQNEVIQKPTPSSSSSSSIGIYKAAREARGSINDFEDFWTLYPKQQGKLKAEAAWDALDLTQAEMEEIRTSLAWQVVQWRGGEFAPEPANYLEGRRWLDRPGAPPPADETPGAKALAASPDENAGGEASQARGEAGKARKAGAQAGRKGLVVPRTDHELVREEDLPPEYRALLDRFKPGGRQ